MNVKSISPIENTAHVTCMRLVDAMVAYGAKYAVCCPGTRNAPLLMAIARCRNLEKVVITDERSAGYVALGLAQQSRQMVAVVCTSGTALSNLAPAAAEAFYSHLPLVIISADRPKEWIDQNDSQTMHQAEVLADAVKWRCTLPSMPSSDEESWWVNRMINEAIINVTSAPVAPIHINVHIGEPINQTATIPSGYTKVISTPIRHTLAPETAVSLNTEICSAHRVMVVCGFMSPDQHLTKALSTFAKRDNAVVLCEQIANMPSDDIMTQAATVISEMGKEEREMLAPDLLIYVGGALVSRMTKEFFRKFAIREQWRVGNDRCIIDSFKHCNRIVDLSPVDFFEAINNCAPTSNSTNSDYAYLWQGLRKRALSSHQRYMENAQWSTLSAMNIVSNHIPQGTILHLSNGLSIRLAQLFAMPQISQWWSNRGVSGIDGCTSTALGASIAANGGDVLLITGDMSFSYDINGISSQYNSRHLKVIVTCNGGGGIFRFIKSTSSLPELDRYFEVKRDAPVAQLAKAFGYDFFQADSQESLLNQIDSFFNDSNPAILAISTDSDIDADTLRKYYSRSRKPDLRH